MRTIDFSPMFRNSVGFDRMAQLADAALRTPAAGNQTTYPPYNIEKVSEDDYRISMAVAGFAEQDIDVTVNQNSLIITVKVEKTEDFGINDHCALIEKIEVEEAVKTDLTDAQLDNLTAYFVSLPSEPAMKLWSVVGASSEKNAIGLHTRSGDFLVRILAG